MGFFKCWRSEDGSLSRPEENSALMQGSHADRAERYSPVLELERSAVSAESQVSPLHSNRDWDWAQHSSAPPSSSVGTSDLRASLSSTAQQNQNVKGSARSGSTRHQDSKVASQDSKGGLAEYSLQHLPGDTRSDYFVILRVESDLVHHDAPQNGKFGAKPATLPGSTFQGRVVDHAEYVLSPVFVSRRAMTGFTIMQVRDFATVLRGQLLRDPLMAYAVQRALRHVSANEPRAINHVLTDEDAGGPVLDSENISLHVLQVLPCKWALSHRNGTCSTPVPALLLSYYLPHMPPPSSFMNGSYGQILPQLRDACILERVPNVVTLVDIMGRVLYQNEASLAYMGDWSSAHSAEVMASVDRGRNGRRNSCVEDSVGASTSSDGSLQANGACGTAPPRSVLALLLALEPSCSREILDAVLSGQRWSRTVRVPASLKGKLFSSAQMPCDISEHPVHAVVESRTSSNSQALGVAPEDEDAIFVGCFTVRAKYMTEIPQPPDSPSPTASGHHLKPLGSLDVTRSPPSHSALSPLGMSRLPIMGDSLTSVGRPQSGGTGLRYDSVGSFLIPSGRMDSRSDGPQRRIIALLGGANNGSILRRHNEGQRGHNEGRGGSLPKPTIAPIEALQRLSSSHSEPAVMNPSQEGGNSSDSTPDRVSEVAQPKEAFGSIKDSPPEPSAATSTTITTTTGRRITFWDKNEEPSSISEPGDARPTAVMSRSSAPPAPPTVEPPPLAGERSSPSTRPGRVQPSDGNRTRRMSMAGAGLARTASSAARVLPDPSDFFPDRTQDLWHEIHAIPLVDPILDKPAILLVQMDVTRMVLSEERLGDLTDAQLCMLEQLFPRHVIEYMLSHAPSTLSRNLGQLASYHPQVTITFFDIVGFTSMSRSADARQVLVFLNELYTRFDELIDKHQLYKIDVVGDCYIVCAGLISKDTDGFERVQTDGDVTPEEAAWQARSVMAFCKSILVESKKIKMPNGERTQLRMGLHCGPVVSGLVGPKMPKFTCFGDSMNFASRMESTGKPGCIQASAAIATLIPEERWVLTSGVQVKGIGIVDTFMWCPEEESPPSPPPAPSPRC